MHIIRVIVCSLFVVLGVSFSASTEAETICISGCDFGALPPAPPGSTGTDGDFLVLSDIRLAAGTYNFTTLFIADNATLSFLSTGAPQDIYLLATSDVTIDGNITAPGNNLFIFAGNSISLAGNIDITGGSLNLSSGATISITGPIAAGTGNSGASLGNTPTLYAGGTANPAVPVPTSILLLLSGLPLFMRRRSPPASTLRYSST